MYNNPSVLQSQISTVCSESWGHVAAARLFTFYQNLLVDAALLYFRGLFRMGLSHWHILFNASGVLFVFGIRFYHCKGIHVK